MPERKFMEEVETHEAPQSPATPPPAVEPAPEVKKDEAPAAVAAAPVAEPEKPKESETDPKESARWRALSDEREKRRKLEVENAYLRGLAEAKKPQNADPKQEQQEIENRFLTDPVNFMRTTVQEAVAAGVLQDRWERSIVSVEREHKDWVEVRDKFLKMAEEDPTLEARVNRHPDPARYAYEYVRQREAVSVPLDVEAERKRIRAEVEADLRKELALSAAKNIPPSLAGANGAGGSGSVKPQLDVDDLFKGKSF